MQQPCLKGSRRAGFTLVELLVVIAIISVLMAMLVSAVFRIIGTGTEFTDRATIGQLDAACKNFYARYNFYPPSRIFLCNDRSKYDNSNPLHVASLSLLNKMFPALTWSGIDWSGGVNTTALNNDGVILEGDQCLVFFLGGIPARDVNGTLTVLGFNGSNPRNPTAADGTRISFFEFKTNNLKLPPNRGPFPVFMNAYGTQPYAYFSSYSGIGRDYNNYHFVTAMQAGTSDCNALGVWPYAEFLGTAQPHRFLNPKSFQIVSAGENGRFGQGTKDAASLWSPTIAASSGAIGPTDTDVDLLPLGHDDLSNFHGLRLGNSSN